MCIGCTRPSFHAVFLREHAKRLIANTFEFRLSTVILAGSLGQDMSVSTSTPRLHSPPPSNNGNSQFQDCLIDEKPYPVQTIPGSLALLSISLTVHQLNVEIVCPNSKAKCDYIAHAADVLFYKKLMSQQTEL